MIKIIRNFSLPMLTILLAILLPVFVTAQQTRQRVMQHRVYRDQPVEMTSIKAKGVNIMPNQKVSGNNEWLNGMTFSFKTFPTNPLYMSAF